MNYLKRWRVVTKAKKLLARRLVLRATQPPAEGPSAEEVERERSMWGPHPDPEVSAIEEFYFRTGSRFLSDLLGAALGEAAPRAFKKALPGEPTAIKRPDGWGELAELFRRGGDPLELRMKWSQVIDRLIKGIFPRHAQEDMAHAAALRAHWLGKVRARTEEDAVLAQQPHERWMSPQEREAMAWTKTRALQHCQNLEDEARSGLMNVMIRTREAGLGTQGFARACFDSFSQLNRDWRRLSLTETAGAVTNGQIAAVDPAEGWEAVWVSARGGCKWCQRFNRQVFRVIAPPKPGEKVDGDRCIWVGKTNYGRSGNLRTKDGRVRTKGELWWAVIPCHPNCACSLVMRRVRSRGGG